MSSNRLLAISFVLAAPAAAQYGLSTTVLSTVSPTPIPRSIVMVPNPVGLHAICSMTQQSRQIPVDVTNPLAPTVGAPATITRDQYCDAVYTPDFGGRLVSAHRFGGLQVWDATMPSLAGPLPALGFSATNYSHEGLKTYFHQGVTYVLYGEQHTSPTTQGGLEIWRLDSGGVSFVGEHMMTAAAGRALTVSQDGRIVWQWGDQNNDNLDGVLRVYSTNGYTGAPILINTVTHPFVQTYTDKDIESNAVQTNLLSALGWDGLRAIDISVVTSPVINTVFGPSTSLFFDGVTFVPSTNIAVVWGLIRIGTTDIDFLAFFDASIPGAAVPLLVIPPGFRVDDVKVQGNHLYCLGRDRAAAMAPILVVY
ncbi:MAG: hypothetical protein R3F56_23395 [Planctomycetota bacterium]